MSAVATDIFFSSSSILSSNSNPHHRTRSRQASSSPVKKQDRQALPKNQVFTDTTVDSFLISSTNITQSAIDAPKTISSANKRYVSSFKTLVNSTSSKHSQRLSYANDSVIILKLSKENATESATSASQISGKNSVLSIASTTTNTPPRQSSSPPTRSSPVLKVEGQKRRTIANDSSVNPSNYSDVNSATSVTYSMAMSASSHPSSNPSLFAYRNTITANPTVRQRPIAETTTTSLFIATDRLKSNTSSSMRPARQSSTVTAAVATAAMTSVYLPSHPMPQRTFIQTVKPRVQQEKSIHFKDPYEYPDPFTNCPQDLLSKLAQLTKLQLETVEWEKKRRYIKKKPITNNSTHGKDSP